MKILHVVMSVDPVTGGGTAERTLQLARALVLAGATCRVLTLDIGVTWDRRVDFEGIELTAFPTLSRRFFIPGRTRGLLQSAVRESDVVHLVSHWTVLNALAWRAARRFNVPYVVCPAGALRVMGRSNLLKRTYNALAGRRLIRDADAHVAITRAERRQFTGYGVNEAAVTVIPNGAAVPEKPDIAGFRAQARIGESPFLLYVGRLNWIKGPDLLVDAFARVREELTGHHLVLVGPDDGMAEEIRTRTARLGMSHLIHLPGPMGGRLKAGAYASATALIVPSRSEAMSLVALEAGVVGTPVLITDACGFDEIADRGGGFVVPPTVDGLALGLLSLFALNTRLPEMGDHLRCLVLAEYTWAHAADSYLEVMNSLKKRQDDSCR